MPFQVVGEIWENATALRLKSKPYASKIFYTDQTALKHGYSKVYEKDGNTKRTKNVLVNWYVKTIPFGKMEKQSKSKFEYKEW